MAYSAFENEVFPAGIGAAVAEWRVARDLLTDPAKGGPGPLYELGGGDEYWVVTVDMGTLSGDRADSVEAWLNRRRDGLHAGMLTYAARLVPKSWRGIAQDDDGAWNSGGAWNGAPDDWTATKEPWGAPHLVSASNADGTVTIKWFAAGATVTELDPFHFDWQGERFFCRALETRSATSAGLLTAVAIEPRPPNIDTGAQFVPVTFRNPAARIRVVPGALSLRRVSRTRLRAQFTAATPAY